MSEEIVVFERDLSCIQYKPDHGAPNFLVTPLTHQFDLLVKVYDNKDRKLQGCIPCHTVLLAKYCDKIAALVQTERSVPSVDKNGNQRITEYKIYSGQPPQVICNFIKSFYDGRMKLNGYSACAFIDLSSFFQCKMLKTHVQDYVVRNFKHVDIVRLLSWDKSYQEAGINFVRNGPFNHEIMLKEERFGKLPLNKFVEFLSKTESFLTSGVIIALKQAWLVHNPDRDNRKTNRKTDPEVLRVLPERYWSKKQFQQILLSKGKKTSGNIAELTNRHFQFAESPILSNRHVELLNMKVPSLEFTCLKHGIKVKGDAKAVLIERILSFEKNAEEHGSANKENSAVSDTDSVRKSLEEVILL